MPRNAGMLGVWETIYPCTAIFVPSVPFLTIPEDHIAIPVRGSARTLAVMGPPDINGMRLCVGFAILM